VAVGDLANLAFWVLMVAMALLIGWQARKRL
jgi:hypothetical protein